MKYYFLEIEASLMILKEDKDTLCGFNLAMLRLNKNIVFNEIRGISKENYLQRYRCLNIIESNEDIFSILKKYFPDYLL
jgi:hypothetical protein